MTQAKEKPVKRGRPSGALTPGSTADTIQCLQIGESFSKAVRIPATEFLPDRRQREMKTLSNTLDSGVARAKKGVDREYTVNRGEFATGDGHIIITMVVTRTA